MKNSQLTNGLILEAEMLIRKPAQGKADTSIKFDFILAALTHLPHYDFRHNHNPAFETGGSHGFTLICHYQQRSVKPCLNIILIL
jgi:hypothetical protein